MTLSSSFLRSIVMRPSRFLMIGGSVVLSVMVQPLPGFSADMTVPIAAPVPDVVQPPPLAALETEPADSKIPSLSDALENVPGGGDPPRLVPKHESSFDSKSADSAETSPSDPGMNLPVGDIQTPEQAQMVMRGEAFESMMNGVLPMKPDELREAFGRMDVNQQVIEEPLKFPKPEVSFTTVSLDPATEPLTFKLATGHVTTVSFLDITGQPWPIKDVTWAGNFEVKSSSQGADDKFPMYPNLMRIIPLSEYAYGNMSIRLLGLATPMTFTLRTNKDVVQYRLDLRVPEQGPFALPSPMSATGGNTLKAGNASLTRIMEGIPPDAALKMALDGVDGRTSAYVLNDMLYVRTPLTLLSPAWSESVRSADGMNVYALSTAPVLLLSDQGQMVRVSVMDMQGKDHD